MIYQWWLVRIPVLLLIPFIFYDMEILFLLSSFLILHLTHGLKTIVNDYLQNYTLKVLLLLLVRLSSFEFLRYMLEIFI